jgi:hypothetical protein
MLLEDGPHLLAASLPEAMGASHRLKKRIEIQRRLEEDHAATLRVEVEAMGPTLI